MRSRQLPSSRISYFTSRNIGWGECSPESFPIRGSPGAHMSDFRAQVLEGVEGSYLCRGEVVGLTKSGAVVVGLDDDQAEQTICDLLVTNDGAGLVLAPRDQVLVWFPPSGLRAVIIGRIGPSNRLEPQPEDPPVSLTIEAKHSLTLRVGDGS